MFIDDVKDCVKNALVDDVNALSLYQKFENSQVMETIIWVSPFFDSDTPSDLKKEFIRNNKMVMISIRAAILVILSGTSADVQTKFKDSFFNLMMQFEQILSNLKFK